MRRRHYLAGLAVGFGSLAGCTDGSLSPGGSSDAPEAGTPTGGATPRPGGDVELPLAESELSRGAPKDGIPAITEPSFAPDWSELPSRDAGRGSIAPRLGAEDRVVGVTRNGEARAYPLRILNLHEIVNDDFGGPLLVTYCPLCGSGVTAERRVEGAETIFGVSGLLWRSDLVMYDRRTESLWSQILGQAVRGPRTGDRLELVPSRITTWESWRSAHPDTVVMLPPPESGTITGRAYGSYENNPYAGYEDSRRIGIGRNDLEDDRLHPKAQVIGVTHDGSAKAYPLSAISEAGAVNDVVGDRSVVVAAGADGTLVAYDRRVEGETLDFERADEDHLAADGSRWGLLSGEAVDGPHEGATLAPANDRSQLFWFAWVDFHPETALYGE